MRRVQIWKKGAVILATITALTFTLGLGACGSDSAEQGSGGSSVAAGTTAAAVYTNGVVYTVAKEGWQDAPLEAIAVAEDGTILAVGTNDEIGQYVGDGTEEIDLDGQTVLPGMIDSHLHLPGTALTELYEIYLYDAFTKENTLAAIAEFIEENPDLEAYFGTGFDMSIGESGNGPRAEWLDEICQDKPIVLISSDAHTYWMNTIAFEMQDISPETAPENVTVPVDSATGKVWGTVTDALEGYITLEPEYTEEQYQEALNYFQETQVSYGITTVQDLAFLSIEPEQFAEFASGDLVMRVNLSGGAQANSHIDQVIAETKALAEEYADNPLVKVNTIKFFEDGVVEAVTAALTEPYAEGAETDPDFKGEVFYDPEFLKEFFAAAYAEGIQVHAHATGDQAVKDILDAIEYAQEQNPDVEDRPVITHNQVVDPADFERYAADGVIASTQPFWHLKEPEWFEYVDEPFLGEERAEKEYPVASFVNAGVTVTFSSDSPVSDFNYPFYAIEVAVTRNLEDPDYYGVDDITDIDDPTYLLNPEERISVWQAVEAYTKNGAYQLFRENEVGSLEAGKQADFIVIDQDIITIDPLRINETSVLRTIIGGAEVYTAE